VGVIYQIRIDGGSKTYVGSAHNLTYRKRSHLSLLRKGAHHCRALQNAVKKYGFDAISWIVLEEVADRALLIEREQAWLDLLKGQLYNKSPTAGSRLGATMSASARAKISASLKGNQRRKGIPHNVETKALISDKLRAMYASGERTPSTHGALETYWDRIHAGDEEHPTKRTSPEIIRALSDLAATRSVRITARRLGMNQENVRAIINQAIGILETAVGPTHRRKHERGYFIHPSWFSTIEESA
jgi:group I intron endonuclease